MAYTRGGGYVFLTRSGEEEPGLIPDMHYAGQLNTN